MKTILYISIFFYSFILSSQSTCQKLNRLFLHIKYISEENGSNKFLSTPLTTPTHQKVLSNYLII